MAGKDERREPRVDLDLSVTLQLSDGEAEYEVGDASYRGVFLISEDPLPLRKLVRFETRLDDDEEPLEMMGLVAHHIGPAEADHMGRDPGMGIHLFSVGEETHRRWREFIQKHYEEDPEAREQVKRLEYPRVVAHLSSHDELDEFFSDDYSEGALFVRSSEIHGSGEDVICDIVHPDGDETLDLEARVVDTVESPPRERGVELEFRDLDERDRSRAEAFAAGDFDRFEEIEQSFPDELDEASDADETSEQAESSDAEAADEPGDGGNVISGEATTGPSD